MRSATTESLGYTGEADLQIPASPPHLLTVARPPAQCYNLGVVSRKRPSGIDDVLERPPGPARTAALAAWVQGLYESEPAVLVGGAAAELYSGGAYTTGDIDLVGSVPALVEERLRGAGFVQKGRYWIHPDGLFVEFPGSHLDHHEQVRELRAEGSTVLVVSPEDLIADRLAHWQFWKSTIDALNALTIRRLWAGRLDLERLQAAAGAQEVAPALESLESFVETLGSRTPESEELEEWARRPPE